jgi:acetyltransferase
MNTFIEKKFANNFTIRDGTEVAIRPIQSEDAFGLQALFNRLSYATIYFRFLNFKSFIADAELLHLATVDYRNRMAFVATRWVTGIEEILGVARYDVIENTALSEAEVAIVVEDQYQGQGLGTRLMEDLIRYGHLNGIRRFKYLVHESNYHFLRFLHHLGLPLESTRQYGTWEMRMNLDGISQAWKSHCERNN